MLKKLKSEFITATNVTVLPKRCTECKQPDVELTKKAGLCKACLQEALAW